MEQANILMITDGSPFVSTMAGLLDSKGFKTALLETSAEAMGALRKCSYDMVILKYSSEQNLSGSLLPQIRDLCPHAKLVILCDQTMLPVEAYEVAVDDYIMMSSGYTEIWRRLFSTLKEVTSKLVISSAAQRQDASNDQAANRLGIMFHDLRGSLVTIAAGLKMLQRKSQGSLGEDSVKFLEETLSKTKILISTTDDFLQSYFSSGECFENKQKCFDLREDIIDPVLYEMRDEILRNHITLINRQDVLPASQTPVQGDRVALKSAFRNLLTNAIKHAGHGGTIRLDMTRQGATWLLRVYNSGPSVPEHLCTTLFSQPALSAAGNNGDNQGLGLGLYLSRKIVNSCGGNIQYLPGQDGSNFILTFPCH